MSNIILIYNDKGGVAKTTSAVNIAAALTQKGYSSLVIDAAGDSYASYIYGAADEKNTIYDLILNEKTVEECIYHSSMGDIIPCKPFISPIPDNALEENISRFDSNDDAIDSIDSDEAVMEPIDSAEDIVEPIEQSPLSRFKNEIAYISSVYDYILIDTDTTHSPLFKLCLMAADYILIPTTCDQFTYISYSNMIKTFPELLAINPGIKFLGTFITIFESNKAAKHYSSEYQKLNRQIGIRLFDTVIKSSVDIQKALAGQKSIFAYNSECSAAQQYMDLTEEIVSLTQSSRENM